MLVAFELCLRHLANPYVIFLTANSSSSEALGQLQVFEVGKCSAMQGETQVVKVNDCLEDFPVHFL